MEKIWFDLCKWCGKPMVKTHGNQEYHQGENGEPNCLNARHNQRSADNMFNHRQKYHDYLIEEKEYKEMGSSKISGHRDPDFEKEANKVLRERLRLRLK